MQNRIFNPESVIEQTEGFSDIPQNLLMDFVPQIHKHETDILETWKQHFDSISVPYAICKEFDRYTEKKADKITDRKRIVTRFTLWKRRVI